MGDRRTWAVTLVPAVLLAGCGRDAATSRVSVDVRNERAVPVVVRAWPGADPVTVPPGRSALVTGDAPPEPWTVSLTAGGRTTRHEVRLNGAHGLVVTPAGVTADPVRDGLDVGGS